MESMHPVQSTGSGTAVRRALAPTNGQSPVASSASLAAKPALKSVGYGLPCAKCRKYYSADLSACPICQSAERVTPIAVLSCPTVEPAQSDQGLDEQKQRFLREFKAKLYEAHSQIKPTEHPCTYSGEDDAGHDSATVCRVCYERLQQRMDLCESALEMELKEAAQIIYDAVWADTSDSSRTYQNAARALLGELRKRAGMNLGLGGIQPLTH